MERTAMHSKRAAMLHCYGGQGAERNSSAHLWNPGKQSFPDLLEVHRVSYGTQLVYVPWGLCPAVAEPLFHVAQELHAQLRRDFSDSYFEHSLIPAMIIHSRV